MSDIKPSEPELMPCPFCGAQPVLSQNDFLWKINCPVGGCESGLHAFSRENAVKKWNTRVPSSPRQAQGKADPWLVGLASWQKPWSWEKFWFGIIGQTSHMSQHDLAHKAWHEGWHARDPEVAHWKAEAERLQDSLD